MRYDKSELCRVRDGVIKGVIKAKFGGLMKFYAVAAKLCGLNERTLQLFIGCGGVSQRKNAIMVLKVLGLPADDFSKYFVGEDETEGKGNGLLEVTVALEPLLERLSVVERKIDNLTNLISASLPWEAGKSRDRR
jgi:hypothetical protein